MDYAKHCLPLEGFEAVGGEEALLGREGALTVLLVSSGRGSVFAGEQAAAAAAGSFVLAAGPVTLTPLGNCHVVGLALGGAAPQELAAALPGPQAVDSAAAPGAAELLYRLVEGEPLLPEPDASATAYALLCRLASAGPVAASMPPLVASAIALIREHYAEVYGVEELSKELGVSKSHLVRAFSAAVGASPGRYLTSVRLEAAKRLLLHREYPLETVAMLCGFSGANYLCKVFKKATGMPPAAWRARFAPEREAAPAGDEWENRLYL